MLEDYVAAGLDPAAFWSLTPRLFLYQMRGARRRMEGEEELFVRQSWLTAKLSRAEKIPGLKKLLRRRSASTSREELRANLAAMSSALPKVSFAEWRARQRK
ncbi:hypothetical protein [Alloyangia pacifica]|uniref:hypothetical protein n=1 Tax=Alloyangia pacifica TaxID=311180 RepID=UPI001CFE0271|nr:hypothetical protein [Alloyangia pacifica]